MGFWSSSRSMFLSPHETWLSRAVLLDTTNFLPWLVALRDTEGIAYAWEDHHVSCWYSNWTESEGEGLAPTQCFHVGFWKKLIIWFHALFMDFLIDLPNLGNENVLRVTERSESWLDLATKINQVFKHETISPRKSFFWLPSRQKPGTR